MNHPRSAAVSAAGSGGVPPPESCTGTVHEPAGEDACATTTRFIVPMRICGWMWKRFAAVCALGFCLAGCSILKPSAGINPRTFVLTPVQAIPETSRSESTNLVIGIRQVKMPGYLSTKSLAVRKNNNEIVYPELFQWAERLDGAMQQVLGADLSTLIPTDQVRFSMWDPETVTVQIEVNVARFDVDSGGEAALIAWWRVLSPSGALISSGRFSETRKGPAPETNPGAAVSAMSSLAGDLAGELAREIKRAPAPRV